MNGTNQATLALDPRQAFIGVELLSEQELNEIEGGTLWIGIGMVIGAGALACVIGVGIGVGLYYMMG